ncbi:MAG: hypothetical protein WD278_11030, partial [Pirellulales bacterium]
MLRACAASKGSSRCTLLLVWPSPSQHRVGTPVEVISELNTWPAFSPVNASPATLPPPAHDSRASVVRYSFAVGSCVSDSLPVFTGAFA